MMMDPSITEDDNNDGGRKEGRIRILLKPKTKRRKEGVDDRERLKG